VTRARALIAVAAIAWAGCGSSDDEGRAPKPVVGTFVGTLAGDDAYVAVVAGKENVVAYVCHGERGIGRLFVGRRSGAAFESRSGGDRITVKLADDGARGRVTLRGAAPAQFAAQPARGDAGFYRTVARRDGREIRVGWVVVGDGSQRGALVQDATATEAPSLRPSDTTFTLAGRRLSAVRVSPKGADAAGLMGFGGLQGLGG
jgi:hypothetical protein